MTVKVKRRISVGTVTTNYSNVVLAKFHKDRAILWLKDSDMIAIFYNQEDVEDVEVVEY